MSTVELAGPPAHLRFRRRVRIVASLRELWLFRELVRSLTEREIRVRYKQTYLGFAWVLITPVALMVVFTMFFRRIADVDTGGAPYVLFSYLGVLPWTFFSSSLSHGGLSLVTNAPLLNKVHCPREVFPVASTIVAAMDSALSACALGVLFVLTGYLPRATSAWVPVLLMVQVAFTVGVTLIVAGVVVYLRDLRHALPLILQLGVFATPVAYGIEAVPESLQVVYATLNPLAAVIDGYRRSVLFGLAPDWSLVGPAAATSVVVLIGAYKVFKRLETGIADAA
jgi:ABC-2 type transport system permease protein/lipopolysaccharide transport system permease protein